MEEAAPVTQTPPNQPKSISMLADLSLVLGLFSFCLPLLAIPAIILGFIAIVKTQQPFVACAGIMLGFVALVLFGAVALFAMEKFNLNLSHYDWGAYYCQQGNHLKAIDEFTQVLEKSPDANIYHIRASLYCRLADYDKAVADFSRAIELNPGDSKSYALRGLIYWQTGDLKNAFQDWQSAKRAGAKPEQAYLLPDFEKYPLEHKTPSGCPDTRPEKQKTRDSQIKKLTENILSHPKEFNLYSERGRVYEDKGEYDIALADYTSAIVLDPASIDSYYNRAFLKDLMGDLDGAISDYDKIIEIEPDSDAFYNRAEIRYKKGMFNDAIADRKIALDLERGWEETKLPIAKASQPDMDEAEACLDRGLACNVKNDYANAIAEFTRAIKLRPTYTDAYIYRANAYKETNRHKQALSDYTRAIELKTDNPMAYINRAVIYLDNRDYDKTIVDCSSALKIKPGILHAYYYRGKAFHAKGEYDIALADYRKAMKEGSYFMPANEKEPVSSLIEKTKKAKQAKEQK